MKDVREKSKENLPKNNSNDRKLDCAVINFLHDSRKNNKELQSYTSVRAMFPEGQPLYDKAGFNSENHIQICVRNLSSILGFFLVESKDYK